MQFKWKMYFLNLFHPLLLSSLFSPPPHPLQRNTASKPHRWTVSVYFQECYGHLGIWRCCVVITPLVKINQDLIRPNEKWRGDGGNQELVYSCLGAVQNNPLKCPGSALTSLRLLLPLSVCMNAHVAHCHFWPNCFWPRFTFFFFFFDVLEPTLNWADQNVFCVMLKRQKRKNPRNGAKKVSNIIWFGLPYTVETPNLIPTQVHNITIYHCN